MTASNIIKYADVNVLKYGAQKSVNEWRIIIINMSKSDGKPFQYLFSRQKNIIMYYLHFTLFSNTKISKNDI